MSSNSTVSTYAALIVASLCVGYWAGIGSTLSISRPSASSEQEVVSTDTDEGSVQDYDSEDDQNPGNLEKVRVNPEDDCKLILVVRTDLGMSSGKIAAQCSHATLACYKALASSNLKLLHHWERTGQTKIAVRCNSEDEMLLLQASAKSLNLCACTIQDAGRTQIAAGSRTVLGIGPGPSRLVNQITGKLKLL